MYVKVALISGALITLLLAGCASTSSSDPIVESGILLAHRAEEIWSAEGWKEADRYEIIFMDAKLQQKLLGSIIVDYKLPSPLQFQGETIYFVTEKRQLAAFNIHTGERSLLSIPDLEPNTNDSSPEENSAFLKDFTSKGDQVLILEGSCKSGSQCQLIQYDIHSSESNNRLQIHELLSDWREGEIADEIFLVHHFHSGQTLLFTKKDQSIRNQHPKELVTVYSFDPNAKKLHVVASGVYVHCGFYGQCTLEEQLMQRRLDPYLGSMQDVRCGVIQAIQSKEDPPRLTIKNDTRSKDFTNAISLGCLPDARGIKTM